MARCKTCIAGALESLLVSLARNISTEAALSLTADTGAGGPTDARIDPAKVGEPRRLVVITATGFAYERTDGVAVVPITALAP